MRGRIADSMLNWLHSEPSVRRPVTEIYFKPRFVLTLPVMVKGAQLGFVF